MLSAGGHLSDRVTPYTGVWIETLNLEQYIMTVVVTPYTGVWIETSHLQRPPSPKACHPLYGGVD